MLLGLNSGAGIEKPLLLVTSGMGRISLSLVMASEFSKCGQNWDSPALPTVVLSVPRGR